ncbi:TPA: tail assembly protein [Enterobacter hormaechei]|jgi:predicted phage tail protein|uniref:tail assembly protein n=1 Tax=Enterobacter cloacae complex TaxID=354276 RepID=UPI00075382A9|nr:MULTISPECIES: tail assembly protein [Enterobacter cloacae complex]EKY4104480.1 tail assembly protein [Enterobacter hormaechei subsp. steigerwaltii]MBE3302874.1 tail assembly protein [Enterobacter cloacae complex sp. P30U]EGQ5285061.1 tail assembly protein [Enterobacter hormaechei]EHN8864196.1 tail assembly protein [Enterobacter hormaechei]EKV8998584.1 tail assembly protein [Enterobacter hormaechei]
MARLTTIRLYGALGARFGRVHKLAVQTSAEAVKALCINFDGLEDYLMNAKKNGMTFAVFRGKRNIGVDDFKALSGDTDIRIAPVMEGAKKAGIFQTILGAVMVVAGIVVSGLSAGWAGPVGGAMISAGIGMMAGGIYQMLSPQPKGLQGRDDPDNKPSYAFGGSVNTLAMGNPVALLYGVREIGGAIISAGIVAEDI